MAQQLQDIYESRVAEGTLAPDAAQRAVLPVLEDIRRHLESAPARRGNRKGGLLGGLFHRPEDVPRGLYLWGGVGRGKSMLMDMFFAQTDIGGKRRVHFHAFMQDVHARLATARAQGLEDPIAQVGADLAKGLRLLAFDEVQISDIADAMIVGRLFERLFNAGVVIVATSNRRPDDLYKNGLNRGLFLPFIQMIKARMVVHELASPTDFRSQIPAGGPVWFCPNDKRACQRIDALWHKLAGGHTAPMSLRVQGREVTLPQAHGAMARATFYDLCGTPLGPADYLAIAGALWLLVLTDIPTLSRDNFNEAKRFVTLIDTLYEARVRLIASAAAPPDLLYLEGEGSFEFERTASRLHEMMGSNWGRAAGAPPITPRS